MYTFLKINAVSIPSQISGKQHGVLEICLKDEIYNNLTSEDFTKLQNPGTFLTILYDAIGLKISKVFVTTKKNYANGKTLLTLTIVYSNN